MVYKEQRKLVEAVATWIKQESKFGKKVSAQEIADHFGISLREARHIHGEVNHGV